MVKKIDQQAKQQDDDRKFILDPFQWVTWPLCPLKRYPKDQSIECGIIIALANDDPRRFHIHCVNLFGIKNGTPISNIMDDPKLKHYTYSTLKELLDDGWMVD